MAGAPVVVVIEVVLDAREVVAGAVAVADDCFPAPLEHAVKQTMNAPRKALRVSDRLVTKIDVRGSCASAPAPTVGGSTIPALTPADSMSCCTGSPPVRTRRTEARCLAGIGNVANRVDEHDELVGAPRHRCVATGSVG
jgi:hypothetical protein